MRSSRLGSTSSRFRSEADIDLVALTESGFMSTRPNESESLRARVTRSLHCMSPDMAQSGLSEGPAVMSAFGGKADIG